jgi:hypothetical protein
MFTLDQLGLDMATLSHLRSDVEIFVDDDGGAKAKIKRHIHATSIALVFIAVLIVPSVLKPHFFFQFSNCLSDYRKYNLRDL